MPLNFITKVYHLFENWYKLSVARMAREINMKTGGIILIIFLTLKPIFTSDILVFKNCWIFQANCMFLVAKGTPRVLLSVMILSPTSGLSLTLESSTTSTEATLDVLLTNLGTGTFASLVIQTLFRALICSVYSPGSDLMSFRQFGVSVSSETSTHKPPQNFGSIAPMLRLISLGVLEGSMKETFVIKIVCKKITAEGDYHINHKTK